MKAKPAIIDTHVHFFDKGDAELDLEWSWLEARGWSRSLYSWQYRSDKGYSI